MCIRDRRIVNNELNHPNQLNHSYIQEILGGSENPALDYLISESAFQNGEVNIADQKLDEITIKYNLTNEQVWNHTKYQTLRTFVKTLQQGNKYMDELIPTEYQEVIDFAEQEPDLATIKAQSWLNFYYNGDYFL